MTDAQNEMSESEIAAELELTQRLEGIFMPYATRRRQDLIKQQGRFVHYTSAGAGLNIVRSRSLWMRNTTCMSDWSEVNHGFQRLNGHPTLASLVDKLNSGLNGLGKEAVDLFNQWWGNTQTQTYITSVSEHSPTEDTHGRLSMWRAFSKGTARVALVFRPPLDNPRFAAPLNILVSPVAYFTTDELGAELDRIIQNIGTNWEFLSTVKRERLLATAFYMFMMAVVGLKHEGFLEEREWRIIYGPMRLPSELMRYDVEVVDGVPQKVYKIPLNSNGNPALAGVDLSNILDRVIIGPSPYPYVMYDAFVSELTHVGVADAAQRVFVSGIPIRD